MAAVVGTVSAVIGIAGFAQQLAQSVLQIKRFCDAVKDAPEEIHETLDQLTSIADLMLQIRNDEELNTMEGTSATTLKQSLDHCQRAVARVCNLATELRQDLDRRRLKTSVKIVLRQDTFNKMLTRLERCKGDLSLAYSLYTHACRAREFEQISSRLNEVHAAQVETLSVVQASACLTAHRESTATSTGRQRAYDRSSRILTCYRVSLPCWMSRRACEIGFTVCAGFWTASLKTFRVLECNSTAFESFRLGDVDGIRELLDMRQLSVHDENVHGESLMSRAMAEGRTELVDFLMYHGAQFSWRSFYHDADLRSAILRSEPSLDAVRSLATWVLKRCDESNACFLFRNDVEILLADVTRLGPQDLLRYLCIVMGFVLDYGCVERARGALLSFRISFGPHFDVFHDIRGGNVLEQGQWFVTDHRCRG